MKGRGVAAPWLRHNLAMQFISSQAGTTALVLDSPHSGTSYPADFNHACDLALLRTAEDTHVEKLYSFAPALGVAWIEVETEARALNKVRLGKGLIWRATDEGIPIYARRLGVAEVQQRIARCWVPYHAAVAQAIEAAHARHGYSIHINCHSMPAVASSHATDFPGLVHADFVIGNRDDTTASAGLTRAICKLLQDLGYSVAYNHPYKGVELIRRYADPARHRHGIQIEINRRLYMNEQTLAITPAFQRLQADLQSLVRWLLSIDPRTLQT